MKKLFIPLLVALFLTACGGGGSEPKDVAEKFMKAMSEQDIEEAKKHASQKSHQVLDMIGGTMSMMPDSVKNQEQEFVFKFVKDSVVDDRAWVWAENQEGPQDPIELVKEDGEWKVVFSKS